MSKIWCIQSTQNIIYSTSSELIKISRWVGKRRDSFLCHVERRSRADAWVERQSRSADDVWGVGWLNRWWINHIIGWCAIHWCENIHSTGNIVSDLWPSFCSQGTWFYCNFSAGSSRLLFPIILCPALERDSLCPCKRENGWGNAPVLWRYNRYQMRAHFHTEITTLHLHCTPEPLHICT